MNDVVMLALILLLASCGYAAGRVHGQFGHRLGYRYGYRQGYFDGDRASWNRRRRDLQAAVASVLKSPPVSPLDVRPETYPDRLVGNTYTSSAHEQDELEGWDDEAEPVTGDLTVPRGRHARTERDDRNDDPDDRANERPLAEVGRDG